MRNALRNVGLAGFWYRSGSGVQERFRSSVRCWCWVIGREDAFFALLKQFDECINAGAKALDLRRINANGIRKFFVREVAHRARGQEMFVRAARGTAGVSGLRLTKLDGVVAEVRMQHTTEWLRGNRLRIRNWCAHRFISVRRHVVVCHGGYFTS